jgi:hypothetical protein
VKLEFSVDIDKQTKTRQLLGLSYGLIAGLAFTITAWGVDAFQLGRSSADFFWLKLVVGGLAALVLGGLVGWLGEKIDNGLITFILWLATAYILARLANQLPFTFTSKFIGILDPSFQGQVLYPYPSNVDRRMIIVYIVTLLTCGLGGALQSFLVDSALGAATTFARWLTIVVCVPFFLLAGNAIDNINNPLREPVMATHGVIQLARANQGKPIDDKMAADLGLRSVMAIQSLLSRPYRLVLGTYDQEYLDSYSVYVDFNGEWATCSALVDRLSNCDLSQKVFLNGLSDLLSGGSDLSNNLQVAKPAKQWLATWQGQGSTPARLVIRDQRGTAILVEVQDQNGRSYQCLLKVDISGQRQLEACDPLGPPGALGQASQPATVTPRTSSVVSPETLTPTPADNFTEDTFGFVGQEVAMLPASLPDLKALPDLTAYNLQVSVDFVNHSFQGHARVDTTNHTQASLDRLYFRLFPNGGRSYGDGALKVYQISQDGRPLQTSLSVDDTVLEVRLAAPLPAGARTGLEMEFSGVTPAGFGGGYGIYNFDDDLMTMANWYPILAVDDEKGWHLDPTASIGDSVYSDMAYYTVALTVPSELVVATTGLQVKRTEQNGATTYLIASGPARDFFMAMSPDFAVVSREVEGTQVNSYYLPKDVNGGQQALQVAGRALQDYNAQFGLYPYRELDVVEAPLQDALGVEYPGIILAGSGVYGAPTDATFTSVIAHEVGHQWWYNVVGNNVLQDPWLDEGLTTYTSMLYFEDEQGQQGYEGIANYYQNRYTTYLQTHPDDLVTASVAYYEAQPEGGSAYSTMVYTKAALFFKALRQTIGDKAFFQALQDYYKTKKYKVASPQDLLDEFEKASGLDLGDFYQKWLYSKSQP